MNKVERRVVVTGLGVIAPNGHGKEEFTQALRSGKSGIKHHKELEELQFACQVGGVPDSYQDKFRQYFSENDLMSINESIGYGAIAAIDAFEDAGLRRPAHDEDFVYEDTGAIIGTGIGGIDTFGRDVYPKLMNKQVKRLGSTIVERIMMSGVSARVAGLLGLGGQVTSNSSACSTGTEAIIMGTERIRMGLANRMVVGGCEGSGPMVWSGFDAMRVLCRKFNDKPEAASRPMSASAGGFIPGSGAGILVLEELSSALARKAHIYAEVVGTAITCGGHRFGGSMTAPSPRGVQRCIRTALASGNIDPKEIDYINGHLTATMADPLELANWSEALSADRLPYISSTKSMIGHALGAAGAIEMVATLLQMENNFLHPSINCEDLHPDIERYEASIVRKCLETRVQIAAKASFGFGDVNSCIIMKKWSN
jgi:3-oxoacyl-(acyl-carrier-protein) synthase